MITAAHEHRQLKRHKRDAVLRDWNMLFFQKLYGKSLLVFKKMIKDPVIIVCYVAKHILGVILLIYLKFLNE